MTYLGPDRRRNPDRRGTHRFHGGITEAHDERRIADRRTEGLEYVLAGATAEDFAVLAKLWQMHEARQRFNAQCS